MFDITDDELPRLVKHALKARGWRWDAGAQEWRKHNDNGPFSPLQADHVRAFSVDVVSAVKEVEQAEQEAGEKQTASQMNATPGDTGIKLAPDEATFISEQDRAAEMGSNTFEGRDEPESVEYKTD